MSGEYFPGYYMLQVKYVWSTYCGLFVFLLKGIRDPLVLPASDSVLFGR